MVGVLAFSLTLPATLTADPVFGAITVGLGRAVLAGPLAVTVLLIRGQKLFVPHLLRRLAVVVLGIVIGFPMLTALALQHVTSPHAAVVSGLLPAATAGMAVLRAGERPRLSYWIALGFGLTTVIIFAVVQGAGKLHTSDLAVLLAVVLAGLGYAEGGALAREYGGWRVICWSLVLAFPLLLPITVVAGLLHPPVHVTSNAILSLGYLSVVSMFLGFFAWYSGLAKGGIARVGRLQLAQPVLTLGWSALLLGERVTPATSIAAVVVLATVAIARNAQVKRIDADERARPNNWKSPEC